MLVEESLEAAQSTTKAVSTKATAKAYGGFGFGGGYQRTRVVTRTRYRGGFGGFGGGYYG